MPTPLVPKQSNVHLLEVNSSLISDSDITLLSKGTKFIPAIMTSTDEALKFETKSFISVHQRMKAQRLNNVYPEFLIEGTLKSHYSVVKPKIYNLNAKEIDSIQKLAISPEFIVTPADKNLGITLWGTDHYQQELARQLNAATHYKELTDEQSCRQLIKDIYLKYLPLLQVGSKKIYDILNHKHQKQSFFEMKLPKFYLIPKIHKNPVQGRPIVGAASCHNTIVSRILNNYLLLAMRLLCKESRIQKSVFHQRIFITESSYETHHDLVAFLSQSPIHKSVAIKTFDFTSLYTELKHSDIRMAIFDMLQNARQIDNTMSPQGFAFGQSPQEMNLNRNFLRT